VTPPEPSSGVPSESAPVAQTGPVGPSGPSGASSGPTTPHAPRTRRETWLGAEGPPRKFLARWGFPLFVLVVLILGRGVLLPFVFGGLIAYILAPIVQWMTERKDGTRRMPRGIAIIVCYIVFIAAVVGFMFLLVPRMVGDIARLPKEAQNVYKKLDKEWIPEAAAWLQERFPSLAAPPPSQNLDDESLVVPDEPPVTPRTAVTLTPLPDGRMAVELAPNGIDIKPTEDGGFHVQPVINTPEPTKLEDKLRKYLKQGLAGLQSKLRDAVQVLQDVVAGFIKGIFGFFFTLMIGAFILIDLEKVHKFLRSLFPPNTREDYDVIIAGIDRGLSGVIRGQLLICLINGGLTYVGLLVFGVKYKLILSTVAALMSLIPIFGSILSSVPIVIAALTSGDEGVEIFKGVAMVLWIVGIHLIEANILNPKIIGTSAHIHPVLVIFALFLGEASYGLVGALLAVPILSATAVVFTYLYRKTWKEVPKKLGDPASGPVPLPPTVR
jgi:predicted PurR-regulated permease PerM